MGNPSYQVDLLQYEHSILTVSIRSIIGVLEMWGPNQKPLGPKESLNWLWPSTRVPWIGLAESVANPSRMDLVFTSIVYQKVLEL